MAERAQAMNLKDIKAVLENPASAPEAKELAREQLQWLVTHEGPEQQAARDYHATIKPVGPMAEAEPEAADKSAPCGPPNPALERAVKVTNDRAEAGTDYSTAEDNPAGIEFLLDYYHNPSENKGHGFNYLVKRHSLLLKKAEKFGEAYRKILLDFMAANGLGLKPNLENVRMYAGTESAKYVGMRRVAQEFLEGWQKTGRKKPKRRKRGEQRNRKAG
ncbi:MAG: hypothetical protein WBC04_17830 [Candidatus Acidiferrales bacterium]